MVSKRQYLLLIPFLLAFLWISFSVYSNNRKETARKADLISLAGAFGQMQRSIGTTSSVTLADLTNTMMKNGKILANPLAIDPSIPCYRLGSNLQSGVSSIPDQILVEETDNVNSRVRFQIFGDGRIQMREK